VGYNEIDHCCQNFNLMDQWLETAQRQRRGIVGHCEARLNRSRDVVEIALDRLRENETAFLHPPGVDVECDRPERASRFILLPERDVADGAAQQAGCSRRAAQAPGVLIEGSSFRN